MRGKRSTAHIAEGYHVIMSHINIHHLYCLFVFLLLVSVKADEFDGENHMENSNKNKMRTDEAVTDEEI